MGTVPIERTGQGEVVLRIACIWAGGPCDPQPLPLTEFPPDRLQLADGDHHCSGPPLHWVHREGGDWVLEAGDFGTPFPLGVPRKHVEPFIPEAFPWGFLWTWLKNVTHIPLAVGVYWASRRRTHLARFCLACCPMFPWVGSQAMLGGIWAQPLWPSSKAPSHPFSP